MLISNSGFNLVYSNVFKNKHDAFCWLLSRVFRHRVIKQLQETTNLKLYEVFFDTLSQYSEVETLEYFYNILKCNYIQFADDMDLKY